MKALEIICQGHIEFSKKADEPLLPIVMYYYKNKEEAKGHGDYTVAMINIEKDEKKLLGKKTGEHMGYYYSIDLKK